MKKFGIFLIVTAMIIVTACTSKDAVDTKKSDTDASSSGRVIDRTPQEITGSAITPEGYSGGAEMIP